MRPAKPAPTGTRTPWCTSSSRPRAACATSCEPSRSNNRIAAVSASTRSSTRSKSTCNRSENCRCAASRLATGSRASSGSSEPLRRDDHRNVPRPRARRSPPDHTFHATAVRLERLAFWRSSSNCRRFRRLSLRATLEESVEGEAGARSGGIFIGPDLPGVERSRRRIDEECRVSALIVRDCAHTIKPDRGVIFR